MQAYKRELYRNFYRVRQDVLDMDAEAARRENQATALRAEAAAKRAVLEKLCGCKLEDIEPPKGAATRQEKPAPAAARRPRGRRSYQPKEPKGSALPILQILDGQPCTLEVLRNRLLVEAGVKLEGRGSGALNLIMAKLVQTGSVKRAADGTFTTTQRGRQRIALVPPASVTTPDPSV